MTKNQCPSCNANIKLEPNKKVTVCSYCSTEFIIDTTITTTTQPIIQQQVINRKIPPRPHLRVGLAVFLCFLYVWPGIIYIALIRIKQKEWDETYKKY